MMERTALHLSFMKWMLTRKESYVGTMEVTQEFLVTHTTASRWLEAMVYAGMATKKVQPPDGVRMKRGQGRALFYIRTVVLADAPKDDHQVQKTDVLGNISDQLLATPFNQRLG